MYILFIYILIVMISKFLKIIIIAVDLNGVHD